MGLTRTYILSHILQIHLTFVDFITTIILHHNNIDSRVDIEMAHILNEKVSVN